LRELIKNKTVIVIAHRLSTIRAADQIIVLDQGRIVETGRHEALLAANRLYGRMWEAYSSASVWEFRQEQEEVVQ
jgi:ATP-binding cassette subfamily B protein